MQLFVFSWNIFRSALVKWKADHVSLLAAALAYYTFFSLAPLLVLLIVFAGFLLGENTVQAEILVQIESLIGKVGTMAVQKIIEAVPQPNNGFWASILAFFTLLFGASVTFLHLQEALNTIWEVKKTNTNRLWNFFRARAISFAIVMVSGFFMLVSLLINAALVVLSRYYHDFFKNMEFLWRGLNMTISFIVISSLFALIYKFIPDVKIKWQHVWPGAIVAACLFNIGKNLMGFYLGWSSFISIYAAAGSLVVILVWIYYACHILFFGAELIQAYARHDNRKSY